MSIVPPFRSELLATIWPRLRPNFRKEQLLICFGGAALLALSAQVSFPLPITPVPLCLAAQVVCWLAWNCPTTAPRSVALYLCGAGLQLPILAIGGGGWIQLAGPRGGYLLGYYMAVLAVGKYRRASGTSPSWKRALLAQWIGSAVILLAGSARLAMLLGVERAWQWGLAPFLIGDFLIKAPLMSALATCTKKKSALANQQNYS